MNTTKTTEAATHTPGPWYVDKPYGEESVYVSAARDTSLLCKLYERTRLGWPNDSAGANARLIAAAPDLLECLENAIVGSGFYISGPTHPDVCEDEGEPRWVGFARAAIAKARGTNAQT